MKNYKTAPHHLSHSATLPRCNTEAVSLFDFSMTYESMNAGIQYKSYFVETFPQQDIVVDRFWDAISLSSSII